MATTDLGLTLHPDNAQLLKMKGDILRDMKEMLEAEKVKYFIICGPASVLLTVLQEGLESVIRYCRGSS